MSKTPLLMVAMLLSGSLLVQAQDKKPTPSPKPVEAEEVVRINTDLVQTDVMVFDKKGKFVNGLGREQFELLIDGQPQPITFFDSVVMGSGNERAALRASRGNKTPPPAVEPAEGERGRTILFFINDLHLAPGSLAFTHKTINRFIDQMLGPNDQVAITSASGQIGFLQQLTNNPTVLRAALERLKFVPTTARDGERPYISDYAAFLIGEQRDRALFDYYVEQTMKLNNIEGLQGGRPGKGAGLPQDQFGLAASIVNRRVGTILRDSQFTIKQAMSSLVNLMDVTTKLPGRKLVFFISDGLLFNYSGSDITSMLGRAAGSANRSGVVIYSLDARGLSNDSSLDASLSGGGDPSGLLQSRMSGERTFSQEALYSLAADTGGRAVLNSNALDEAIAQALDETSRYYLLGWRPENDAQRKSNFSKIKVTIAGRPELKVQLRRGYLGAPAPAVKAKADPTTVQIEKTDDFGVTEDSAEEIRTALALGYKQAAGANVQLSSSVQASAQSPDNGSGRLDVMVLGAVFDSRGKPVGSFKQRVEVQRTPARAAPIYATVNHQVDLPPGLYQVRTFAYERGTTHLNGAMEWIELPKLKPGAFSLSSLYVGEITDASSSSQVTVNASGRFARSSRMRFTAYIYNAAHNAGPAQLTAQIKVLRAGQAVITPPETKVSTDKVTNFANITYAGEFPLSSLPAGNYVLDVTITDKAATTSASRQLKFTIY